jgi:hypothetical protein
MGIVVDVGFNVHIAFATSDLDWKADHLTVTAESSPPPKHPKVVFIDPSQ